jgi:hypothetical protein
MAIRYAPYSMGYDVSGRRYGTFPNGNYNASGGPQQPRIPARAQGMDSAPTGSRPVVIYEPNGRARWALNHGGAWRPLEQFKDAGGVQRWRMQDTFINSPVAWTSS